MLESLEKLRERGFRSPRVLVGPVRCVTSAFRASPSFSGTGPECRVPLDDLYLEGYGLEHGRTAARNVLALPPAERPDCMVLCDDIIAQGFFSELVRRQGSRIGYMPARLLPAQPQRADRFSVPRRRQLRGRLPQDRGADG